MNRLLFIFLIAIFVACTINETDRTYQVLKNISNDVNKSCPVQVDSILKLENTVAIPSATFRYNYILPYDP